MEGGFFLRRMTNLRGGSLGILKEGVDPKMAWGYLWLLTWMFLHDIITLGLRSDHVGVLDLKVHMAYEVALDIWRPSDEEGCNFFEDYLTLETYFINIHSLELDMCHL